MAKNKFLDWDSTASNNTDVGGIGILGTNAVSNFDDALRTVMAQLKAGLDGKLTYTVKSSTYLAVANDNNGYIRFTTAATLNLTAAATLGADWHLLAVIADGGDVTVDPNGAELINGAATLTIKNGTSAFIACTGTAFYALATSTPVYPSYLLKTANYTALDADYGASIRFTSAATLAFDVTANLRTNWRIEAWNDSTGIVTLDPDSTNTINGTTTLLLWPGQRAEIFKTGSTTFQANVFSDAQSGAQLQGYVTGLGVTNNGSDTTNDIDIAVGSAGSDVSPYYLMTRTATITKQLDATWAVGSGAGGLDTGSVGNNVYYIWLIQRSDTGVVDALFSLSSTAPTMPSSYDRKRLIGSFSRVGGVNQAPRNTFVETTPWVAYTPTFTGFGTVTAISIFSRRVGDTLQIRGYFTTGTPTATEGRMSLGFNGVDSKVVSDATKVAAIQQAGSVLSSVGTSGTYYSLIESAVSYLTFSFFNASNGALTKVNPSGIFSGSTKYTVTADVPISGW